MANFPGFISQLFFKIKQLTTLLALGFSTILFLPGICFTSEAGSTPSTHDPSHQLSDENALRLLHSKLTPTSNLVVFLKSALDLTSTVVPMDSNLFADVLPSWLEEELRMT